MTKIHTYNKEYSGALAEVSVFAPSAGTTEGHIMLHATDGTQTCEQQVEALQRAESALLADDMSAMTVVFRRYFVSDAANQQSALPQAGAEAVSVVEQPPLDGTKVAMWLYLQSGASVCSLGGNLCEVQRGAYRHLWSGTNCNTLATSEEQTRVLLTDYAARLRDNGCTLEANCIRTWFFVQNVDVNYRGLVKARNEVFATEGLTRDTHYIASTGIGGRGWSPQVFVTMDTYAISGLQQGQLGYLYARTNLNPTYEYGVSFERGAMVDYADRRHVFISGTASINNRGEVVHVGDIRQQTQRMWDNVQALLAEAGCGWDDVEHMIVYLRDVSDYAVVRRMFDERFPHTPRIITYARVCRPTWLVEMECMAVRDADCQQFAPF